MKIRTILLTALAISATLFAVAMIGSAPFVGHGTLTTITH